MKRAERDGESREIRMHQGTREHRAVLECLVQEGMRPRERRL